MNDDINAQKSKARDTIAMGKRLIREGSLEDEGSFHAKMDELKQASDQVRGTICVLLKWLICFEHFLLINWTRTNICSQFSIQKI